MNVNITNQWNLPDILRLFPHSDAHYFEKRVDKLVRIAMPTKMKVEDCVMLVSRMLRASAFDVGSAVRTSAISAGISGAYNHLTDMRDTALIGRKPGKIRHFFVDESKTTNIFVPFDQIDVVRERSVREIIRQTTDKTHVRKALLDFLSVKKVDEIYDKLYGQDKLFNEAVDVLKSKKLLDRQYQFGKIGWRNSSHRWYLTAPILSLI